MFLIGRPSPQAIERFLLRSQQLPLSYGPVGMVRTATVRHDLDEEVVVIGRGEADFERARTALTTWKQFDIGWLELFPTHTPAAEGAVVALLIRHFGFWSLNGCRVVYVVGDGGESASFGFANGTLTNHAEGGEELFEVFMDPQTDEVKYRIRAVSWPQAMLTRLGQPLVRMLQARFRRDSAEAMKRAVRQATSAVA
jgi:uncharacterized protein (UPF0548 family)